MKELSIEEKARRYDEAIERAKNTIEVNRNIPDIVECVESLFPALKESEDERIRENIIATIHLYYGEPLEDEAKEMIAWLEKQGEQKPNYCHHEVDLSNCSEEYTKGYYDGWNNCNQQHAQLEAEQKPAAKYKVGDTVYYDSFGRLVSFVIANIVEDGTDNPMYEDKDGNSVFQNDIVEQNHAWSEEDEKMLNDAIGAVGAADYYTYDDKQEIENWLKSLKDRVQPQLKQEWKQENTGDLTDFENAMMHIGGSFFGENAGLDPNDTNAIKEQAKLLLELVPKQEWSEEDNYNCLLVLGIIKEDPDSSLERKNRLHSWLKSIKDRVQPQSQWKPSEEQMDALLWCVAHLGGADHRVLGELYEHLKKLREE